VPAIYKVKRETLPANIRRALMEENRKAAVITGRSRNDFILNTQIGKTTAVLKDVVPLIEKDGLKVEYFDLGRGLLLAGKKDLFRHLQGNIHDAIGAMAKPSDVFVLDEAFHLFGPSFNPIYWRHMREPIKRSWETIGKRVSEGSRFIFISAMHPLGREFEHFEVLSDAETFTKAPIMEFGVTGLRLHLLQGMRMAFPWLRFMIEG
jgi:hypothetical protein